MLGLLANVTIERTVAAKFGRQPFREQRLINFYFVERDSDMVGRCRAVDLLARSSTSPGAHCQGAPGQPREHAHRSD
jgi:hypothetical protein